MLLLIDNYDSFTYNLYHYLVEVGAEVEVVRHDARTVEEIAANPPQGIVISPGPKDPDAAGITLDAIRYFQDKLPILGVCLGHQALGQAFGAKVVRAPVPVHGKVSPILHDGTGVFAGLPTPCNFTRYHSLVLDPASIPDTLIVNARTEDGVIMGVRHKTLPLHGVQFHPESIASDYGHQLLENFVKATKQITL